MLLRKIEGGLRLYDTLMKAESANFKKHLLLSPTPIESTPKVKRYKFTTKIIVWEVKKWVPPKMGTLAICWLSLGFTSFYHLSDHTNLSHPAFSVVFLSFFFCWFFLFVWQFLSHFTTNLKRYANLSKRVQCYHSRKWARHLLTL